MVHILYLYVKKIKNNYYLEAKDSGNIYAKHFFEEAQQNFDQLCQKACQDHEPCIVNREDNNHVVILSLADFIAWQETHYLLSNLANAQKLLRSFDRARNARLM